jgi:hypothetical protein
MSAEAWAGGGPLGMQSAGPTTTGGGSTDGNLRPAHGVTPSPPSRPCPISFGTGLRSLAMGRGVAVDGWKRAEIGHFGFQRGVTSPSKPQLGLPAQRSERIR